MKCLVTFGALLLSGYIFAQVSVTDLPTDILLGGKGKNKIPIMAADEPGITQVLVLSAQIKPEDENELISYENFEFFKKAKGPKSSKCDKSKKGKDLLKVKGGSWKHIYTVMGGGRLVQVWSRYSEYPEEPGEMEIKEDFVAFDASLVRIEGRVDLYQPLAKPLVDLQPLAMSFVGPAPYLVIAAVKDPAVVSSQAMHSFGKYAKTFIYTSESPDFVDPSVGDVQGVIGGFSTIPLY
jgi:hypothetical protein